MTKTLQELRKEAGYKTAKEFSDAIGMKQTTYARYEQNADNITLKAAKVIADKLQCSIDAVVGREHISVEDMRGPVQKFYDSVTEENRNLIDEFMSFIASREQSAIQRKKREENRRYEELAVDYNRQFYESLSDEEDAFNIAVFGSMGYQKESFAKFVADKLASDREISVTLACEEIEEDIITSTSYEVDDPDISVTTFVITSEDPDRDEKIADVLERKRDGMMRRLEQRDEEVLEKVLIAYDRLRRFRNSKAHDEMFRYSNPS